MDFERPPHGDVVDTDGCLGRLSIGGAAGPAFCVGVLKVGAHDSTPGRPQSARGADHLGRIRAPTNLRRVAVMVPITGSGRKLALSDQPPTRWKRFANGSQAVPANL